MTLLDPPLPLALSTEFEVGETFIVTASVDEDDIYYESDNVFIEAHDFYATHARKSYVDVMITVPASPDMVDNISPDPLMHPVLPLYAHYPPLSLNATICRLLLIMMCLREMWTLCKVP